MSLVDLMHGVDYIYNSSTALTRALSEHDSFMDRIDWGSSGRDTMNKAVISYDEDGKTAARSRGAIYEDTIRNPKKYIKTNKLGQTALPKSVVIAILDAGFLTLRRAEAIKLMKEFVAQFPKEFKKYKNTNASIATLHRRWRAYATHAYYDAEKGIPCHED